ncbi:MAG: hypothetical protein HKN91_07455, partial [Acidimicrobiia bacterium]|nr:hypothetical protein [Acidimicrobiia bacterium]
MNNAGDGQFVDPGKRVRMTKQELAEARDYMEERAKMTRESEALVGRIGEVAPVP